MDKQDNLSVSNPRRSVLKMSVCSLLLEKGFEKVDKQCIESLVEMVQSRK